MKIKKNKKQGRRKEQIVFSEKMIFFGFLGICLSLLIFLVTEHFI